MDCLHRTIELYMQRTSKVTVADTTMICFVIRHRLDCCGLPCACHVPVSAWGAAKTFSLHHSSRCTTLLTAPLPSPLPPTVQLFRASLTRTCIRALALEPQSFGCSLPSNGSAGEGPSIVRPAPRPGHTMSGLPHCTCMVVFEAPVSTNAPEPQAALHRHRSQL